jgi:hypothetical protein
LAPLPSLEADSPPPVQIHNGRVMRSEWADPTDGNPNHRTARTVRAYRARCPLRWCTARHGERSGISPEHLEAADRLRMAFDGARLGFSGLVLDGRPINEVKLHYPPTGPTKTALRWRNPGWWVFR